MIAIQGLSIMKRLFRLLLLLVWIVLLDTTVLMLVLPYAPRVMAVCIKMRAAKQVVRFVPKVTTVHQEQGQEFQTQLFVIQDHLVQIKLPSVLLVMVELIKTNKGKHPVYNAQRVITALKVVLPILHVALVHIADWARHHAHCVTQDNIKMRRHNLNVNYVMQGPFKILKERTHVYSVLLGASVLKVVPTIAHVRLGHLVHYRVK